MTSLATSELRDFHASRFAQIAALREMLVDAGTGRDRRHADLLSGLMRDAVAEILRLQQMISRLDD
jgi:hypothetical protein